MRLSQIKNLLLRSLLRSTPGSWIRSNFETLLITILKMGPVPDHVAFIMDGNRRFAKQNRINLDQAYMLGAETLERAIDFSYQLNIRVITVYAFSMENFNRSDAEIKTIIRLAQICCSRFSQSDGVLARNHATIRCIGNTELLGAEFQETIRAAAQNRGRHDDRILNICMAYSSQEEISNAIKDTVVEILHGLVPEKTFINPPVEQERKEEIGAITANSLSEHMYTAGCPPLDILIRTSGTTRLSDFLLWQCHEKTRIEILDKLWPDITICDLFSVILRWQ